MPNRAGETKRQQMYEYIVSFVQEHLFPPTIEEIRVATELGSKQTVWYHLKELEKLGLVELQRDSNRGIKLTGYKLIKVAN